MRLFVPMKKHILLIVLTGFAHSIRAQHDSRYYLSVEPCFGVMTKKLYCQSLEANSNKEYQKEKLTPAIGAKASFCDHKLRLGLDFSVIYMNKISHGVNYTYSTLQPDPMIPATSSAEFNETRVSIAPYYDFLKSVRYKLALGGIFNIASNKFLSEKTTMQTGREEPHTGYAAEFNSGAKTSYGLYFTTGMTERHLTANLFASYNFHSEKYFNTTETKTGRSLVVGLSVGYAISL